MPIVTEKPINHNAVSGGSLDLYSTRQTNELANDVLCCFSSLQKCVNNAPYFAWETSDNGFAVAQGNCHSWTCPRCGYGRARQEYGRIVEGCRTLATENDIYFVTITCRGKELSLAESEAGYYGWTNKLLTAWRVATKRAGGNWTYVQVTERQRRGHPHSHILTTAAPRDLYDGTKTNWKHVDGRLVSELVPALRSDWFEKRCIAAGLGSQYDISLVESVEGASRYVAKYLFKPTMFTTNWSKGWRRVRYSQSFPARSERETNAMVLLTDADWFALAEKAVIVTPKTAAALDACREHLFGHDVLIRHPAIEA